MVDMIGDICYSAPLTALIFLAGADVAAELEQTNLVHDPTMSQSALTPPATEHAHPFNPFLATRVVSFDHADQTCTDRADANETQDVALQAL